MHTPLSHNQPASDWLDAEAEAKGWGTKPVGKWWFGSTWPRGPNKSE